MTLRTEVEYVASGVRRRDTATTLGAGGLFIATHAPLDEGTHLRVRFRLPGGDQEHALAGRVVWSHGPDDRPARGCGMGIAFDEPAAPLAAELEAIARREGIGEEPPGG